MCPVWPILWRGGPAVILTMYIIQAFGSLPSQQSNNSDYVGSTACGGCHEDLLQSYSMTPMAKSSGKLQRDELHESLGRSEFFHARSGVRYQVVKEKDRYFMEFARPVSGKSTRVQGRRELTHFVGSSMVAQGYLFAVDGFLYQAPVAYYERRRRWDVAPGYEMDSHVDLMRPVQRNCLECHASGVLAIPGTQNRYRDVPFLEGGVSCERCHGPGRRHVEEIAAGDRFKARNIVNPARLDPMRRDSVCAVCHLTGEVNVARAGRSLAIFRAGEQLTDHSVPFVYSKSKSDGVKVIGHFEKLWQSRCKAASGDRLWCGSCHDPHRLPAESEKVAFFRAKCEQCHRDSGCRVPSPVRAKQGNDCAACHMPRTQATDGGHSAFTDHSIPRHAQRSSSPDSHAKSSLMPFWQGIGGERELGIAYAKLAARERRPELIVPALRLLDRAIAAGSQDAEVWLQHGYLYELRGDMEQALTGYQRAYVKDPTLVEAAVNLGAKLAEKRRYTEAIRLWKEALSRNGGLETARINLAMAYLRTGDYATALSLLLKALDDNPDLLPAQRLLEDPRLKALSRMQSQ